MQQNITAPAFEQPQTLPPQSAPAPKRVRRVGTLTMGLSLIAFGVFSIIAFLSGDPLSRFTVLLKFAPVILILLGIELVCNAIFFKNENIKFDWLSAIVSFILIVVSLGASFASILPEIGLSTKNRTETENAVYNDIFAKTTKISDINSVSVNIHSNNYYESPQNINAITPADIIYIDFNLNSTTKDDFCKTAAGICDKLKNSAYFVNAFKVSFTASGTTDSGKECDFAIDLTPNFADYSYNSLISICSEYAYYEDEIEYGEYTEESVENGVIDKQPEADENTPDDEILVDAD